MGLTGLGKVVAQMEYQIGKFIRWIGDMIVKFIRWVIHYLVLLAKAIYHSLERVYLEFQRDPLRFMQFAGSLAIMIYYGLL
ncbi:hypothetical protein AFV7_gp45 [Betalipothrixvirus pezzuloense]|uniref:Uncharacterized protein n=1 Tax=Betalipothrixvirus pezzuloense TaxID=346883 RepID=A7WKR2_9VIRU|nr:hypothetical protein AFV7_gp45 [Acidianus filamentous virus 7]CAJ31665.1 conserved hypothetical protein [Acidianus filamentous virus 7]